jgi:hypothetical protein
MTYLRSMSPPSSGGFGKQITLCHPLHVGFLLGLFFNPEDVGDMFL